MDENRLGSRRCRGEGSRRFEVNGPVGEERDDALVPIVMGVIVDVLVEGRAACDRAADQNQRTERQRGEEARRGADD